MRVILCKKEPKKKRINRLSVLGICLIAAIGLSACGNGRIHNVTVSGTKQESSSVIKEEKDTTTAKQQKETKKETQADITTVTEKLTTIVETTEAATEKSTEQEKDKEREEMKDAAVAFLENEWEPMIRSYGSRIHLTFFDYDLDGLPEMYVMIVEPHGNRDGDIYSYQQGSYVKISQVTFGADDFDSIYEIYRNKDQQWRFLIHTCEIGSQQTSGEHFSVYDLQTKEEKRLCDKYYTWTESGDLVSYEDGQNNEISEEEFNRIIEEAIAGYEKVEYQTKEVGLSLDSDVLQQAVEEALEGYRLLD